MTLLLSLAKWFLIWLGQGIFSRDVHNIFQPLAKIGEINFCAWKKHVTPHRAGC